LTTKQQEADFLALEEIDGSFHPGAWCSAEFPAQYPFIGDIYTKTYTRLVLKFSQ